MKWLMILGIIATLTIAAPGQTTKPNSDAPYVPLPPGVVARLGTPVLHFFDHVTCITFSRDSKFLLVGTDDGQINLIDTATGKLSRTFESEHPGLSAMAVSNDGLTLAVGADGAILQRFPDYQDIRSITTEKVSFIRIGTGKDSSQAPIDMAPPEYTASAKLSNGTPRQDYLPPVATNDPKPRLLAWMPDDDGLIVGGGRAIWFNVKENRTWRTFPHPDGIMTAMRISADGKLLVTAAFEGIVRGWDLTTGKKRYVLDLWPLEIPDGSPASRPSGGVSMTGADGKPIMSEEDYAAPDPDAKPSEKISPQRSPPMALALTPDNKILAVGCADGTIRLFDLSDGKPIRQWQAQKSGVFGLEFFDAGKQLASRDPSAGIRLWDVATAKQTRLLDDAIFQPAHQHQMAISPDGHWLAVCGAYDDHGVRLYNLTDGTRAFFTPTHRTPITGIYPCPDGKTLVTHSSDGSTIFWDAAEYKAHREIVAGQIGAMDKGFALTSDGALMLQPGSSYPIQSLDLKGDGGAKLFVGDPVNRFVYVTDLCLSTDGSLLYSVEDCQVHQRDAKTGESHWVEPLAGDANYKSSFSHGLIFSPDAKSIVTLAWQRVMVLDAATGDRQQVIRDESLLWFGKLVKSQNEARAYAPPGQSARTEPRFLPDGTIIAAATDGLRIFDPATGDLKRTITLKGWPGPNPVSFTISPDGRVAAMCHDGVVDLMDVPRGQPMRQLAIAGTPLTVPTFLWDSKRLVTACPDGTALVWNTQGN